MSPSSPLRINSGHRVAVLRWLLLTAVLCQGMAFAQPVQVAMRVKMTQPQQVAADCLPCPACYVVTAPEKMKLIDRPGASLLYEIEEAEQLGMVGAPALTRRDRPGVSLRVRFCCWRN